MESAQTVIFTRRAFNAIVTETIDKHPIETGGIFLGYVLDNGTWIVVENVAPGFKSTHRSAYFEYDAEFVTYLANVLANQYKGNLQILGLWHRHPGDMDVFSSTDDQTNRNYAADYPYGAVSALVNCDPKWRMTMYHISQGGEYSPAEWYVDEGDIIPEGLTELRYPDTGNLPVFDKHGVIPLRQDVSGNTGKDDGTAQDNMPASGTEDADRENTAPENPDTGIAQDRITGFDRGDLNSPEARPYTFGMAFRDIKTIIRKLMDRTHYADKDNTQL